MIEFVSIDLEVLAVDSIDFDDKSIVIQLERLFRLWRAILNWSSYLRQSEQIQNTL